jgi:hypothetical protein
MGLRSAITGFRTLPALAALALVLPAGAAARQPAVLAPPGDSAVSQYVEIVPTDRGSGTPGPGAQPSGALSAASQRTYDHLGADGRVLVGIVDATAPESASTRTGRGRATHEQLPSAGFTGSRAPAVGVSIAALARTGGRSQLGILADAMSGGASGGLGILLPLLMALTVLAFAARAAARAVRRRRRQDP